MKNFGKKVLALLLSVTMIFTTMLPATINIQASETGNAIGAGVVTSAVKMIPGVGTIASAAFGPLINKVFNVKTNGVISRQIEEVSKKLDEVNKKIDNLEVQVRINHQEVMKGQYETEIKDFYKTMTSVKNGTKSIFSKTSSIIEEAENSNLDKDTAEMLQMLKIACIVKSTTFSFSDFLFQVKTAESAISGTNFESGDNAIVAIYKAYCNDAALGGEAAQMASNVVNGVSTTMQNAYVAANMVLYASLFVNANYRAYEALIENDPNFYTYKKSLDAFAFEKDFSEPAKEIRVDATALWGKDIFDDSDKLVNGKLELNEDTVINIGDKITDGVFGEYNDMVEEAWFWYINGVNYAESPAVISYSKLNKELDFVIASDYGTPTRWDDKTSKTQTGTIESHTRFSAAMRTAPNRGLSREQLKNLLEHINNSEYFGTKETNRVSLEQALKNYGFSFNNYEQYLEDNNKTLPDSTRKAFLTKIDCKVEKHYDRLTTYGPQLTDDVGTACTDFDKTFTIDTNYTKGKRDYISIQLDGNSTDDYVAFYFTSVQTIDSKTDFRDFYQNIANGESYRNKTILLTTDLDLKDYNLLAIWNDAKKENRFCGVFDGGGHTIKNVDMSNGTEWVGLFRSMGIDGEVKNLTITDSKFGNGNGIAIGGVVGQATGDNSLIENVTVSDCIIKGTDYVGGIVGTSSLKEDDYCDDMCAMIRIRNCVSESIIAGTANTGGIEGGGGSVRIENCTNKSTVSSSGVAGGIYGQGLDRNEDPQIIVTNCTNEGDITSIGNHAGGIVGLIYSDSKSHYIYKNENTGLIRAKSTAGGIVGASYGGGTYNNNINSGNIRSESSNAAGIVAWIQDDGGSICNNKNFGFVSGYSTSGGIAGYAGDSDSDRAYNVQNNRNTGNVTVTNGCAGGIFGDIHSDNTGHTVKNNSNTGNISANSLAGGIIGYNVGGGFTAYNSNEGVINSSGDNAGGIVGKIEDDATEIAYNYNYNNVTGRNQTGGIVGYIGSKSEDDKFNIHDNMNCGDIESTLSHAGGIIGHLCTDADHTVNNNINQYASIKGFWTAGGIIGRQDGGGMFDGNKIYKTSVVSSSDAGGIVGYITDDKCDFKNSSIEKEIPAPTSSSSSLFKWLDISFFGKTNADTYDETKIDTQKEIDVKIQGVKRSGKIVGYDDYRDKTLDGDTLLGSIFGQGNIVIILTMLAIILAAGAVIIVVHNKKKNTTVAQ